ncbi:homeobox-DDT domain protein RLT3-like isoform X2 [Humulus lupulus]|uniref:homeobox-DDT domain protein RLT3-like isoform X2 n=1 Tax=Humulus lupulus TaxID=3486 RepID=UPI002B4014EF|nr:homeobox-DDT domain protein RLT3-like isoform X2 [Humulus lupulus]
MVKYGLRPGTLKGALFQIFLEQGNNGLKVSDMAKSFPIFDLKLASTTEELECLICSMLSSEITLFEKISLTTYRLRINSILKKVEELQSDIEDFGAVDDGLSESDAYSSDEDSRCDAKDSTLIEVKKLNNKKNQNGLLNDYTEIDESHPSESWLLGLMEGEYSDLSIEEKLNVMVALIDLLREGSSIRMESVMLEDALIGAWTKSAHKLWVKWLRHTSSLQELMQLRYCHLWSFYWVCFNSGQYRLELLLFGKPTRISIRL